MKCFYHKSDLDGRCSGTIVTMIGNECEMIGVDYNDSLLQMVNDDRIDLIKNETVYMVDFSFSNIKDMIWLNDLCDFHWIDHHKSAIEKMDGFKCKGLREIGKSGCELTWEYLFPDKKMPEFVRLLGRYDVWDHKDADVLPFQSGMRMQDDTMPESNIWDDLLNDDGSLIERIINSGRTILSYERKQNEIYAKGMHYETEFEGLRAIVINKAFQNSKIFDSVYDPEKHDVMILFGVKPNEFKYSIYSTKDEVDVSKIAVKYGGGGHKGAAGFYSKTMIV